MARNTCGKLQHRCGTVQSGRACQITELGVYGRKHFAVIIWPIFLIAIITGHIRKSTSVGWRWHNKIILEYVLYARASYFLYTAKHWHRARFVLYADVLLWGWDTRHFTLLSLTWRASTTKFWILPVMVNIPWSYGSTFFKMCRLCFKTKSERFISLRKRWSNLIMRFLPLRMHRKICFMKDSSILTATYMAVHHISSQNSTYKMKICYDNYMTPSFLTKMHPSFVFEESSHRFWRKIESYMFIQFLLLEK